MIGCLARSAPSHDYAGVTEASAALTVH